MAFYPYLFFTGNCREAFTRYHEIFGGELRLLTAADMPAEERPEGGSEDLIMHAALVADDQLLMGSDDPGGDAGPVKGMQLNFSTTEPAEAQRVFAALVDGGQTVMEMSATSWSPSFGICVDRFGVPWMVSVDGAEG
ncbi:MAG: VOC family protein [Actinomycetota bacterium]|nr:VOC family protein [Actinomycetota bacterium]